MGIEIVDALAHRIGAGDGPRVRGTLQLPLPQAELDGVHGERRRAYQQRPRSRAHDQAIATFAPADPIQPPIGTATWRDRGGHYVSVSVVPVYLKKKKKR